MEVIGIQRAKKFSPNSVEKDLAIIEAVVKPFGGSIIPEEEFSSLDFVPDIVFSMARTPSALGLLSTMEAKGSLVINSPKGVRQCRRSTLEAIMKENHLPAPPGVHGKEKTLRSVTSDGDSKAGYWLKRGDMAAENCNDVVFCEDMVALAKAEENFKARGITDMVVQQHVAGDVVKFYGVEGTGFFRTYYPSDDGMTKFGNEKVNGIAHHYFYQKERLQAVAEQVSRLALTPVYGGDAIVDKNGDFVIIDFNDWPSFSRCRADAAEAIRELARYLYTS